MRQEENSQNKTIVKNTIYLYIRTFLTMLLSIYTSRVVLQVLGVEDYGLYNVVGGIAASFSFLSSMLSNATQRYLNFAIGTNDYEHANQLFNMNLIIYLIYAIVSIIAVEIGGAWFIENKMVVAPERVDAVYYTLHATTIVLAISLISSVYESALIARENMKIYAYMGMYDAIVKLAIVFVISYMPFDKLKTYAVLMALMSISAKLIPTIYCMRHYPETKLKYYWDKGQFKSMFKFVGWNFLGTSVFIINDQGINMLLNSFFGAGVNAARGLSMHVKGAISSFSSGFFTAIRPQIVKSYAAGENERFMQLIFNGTKYTFYLLWLVSLPIMLRVNELLGIWLDDVPEWTGQFVIWICIFNLFNSSFCDPIWQGVQAIGKLKAYVGIGSIVYLLAFPIIWGCFRNGASPIIAFQVIVYVRILYFLITTGVFKKYANFSIYQYVTHTIYPIAKVVIASFAIAYCVNYIFPNNIVSTLIACVLMVILIVWTIFFVGINQSERQIVLTHIKQKLCKK